MKVSTLPICLALLQLQAVYMFAIETDAGGETFLHFDFKTENGQQREENVKYDSRNLATNSLSTTKHPDEEASKSVEVRGGYSFISADGYEYTVKYKANKHGYQPYVTAHKVKNPPAVP